MSVTLGAAGLMALGAVVLIAISSFLNDRERRRPRSSSSKGDLVLCAREHFAKYWQSDRFEVAGASHSRGWWGREQVAFDVEVGWERARITIVVVAADGWLVRFAITPKPGFENATIAEHEAIDIARREAERRSYTWRGLIQTTRDAKTWQVRTNTEMRGCNACFTIDAQTGVVLSHSFLPR